MDKNEYREQNRRSMDLWLQMIRSHDHLQARVGGLLQGRGLTAPQFEALSSLAASDCANQQELADRLRVSKGNLVGLIDRLTERGWVERVPAAEDRRVNGVHITPAGKDRIRSVLPEQARIVEDLFAPLSPEEAETLRRLLKKLLPAT